jgi:hypothetical protein
LNTQYDIKKLEDYEKELLLAGLFTLAGETANENQQPYIRSVKKYLGIANPQTEVDLSGIENIENLATQKAMFQTFSEFLFLKSEDDSFYEEYEEFFDGFSVKQKDRTALFENIMKIYKATGAKGLCEKYGYIGEKIPGKAPFIVDSLNRLLIEDVVKISENEEKIYTGADIRLLENIKCNGKLVFESCIIVYNSAKVKGSIIAGKKATITLNGCTVIDTNNVKKEKVPPMSFEDELDAQEKEDLEKLRKKYIKENDVDPAAYETWEELHKAINDSGLIYTKNEAKRLFEWFKNYQEDENDEEQDAETETESSYFFNGNGGNFYCENTLFYNCKNLANSFVFDIKNSILRFSLLPYSKLPIFDSRKNGEDYSREILEGSMIQNCLIENLDAVIDDSDSDFEKVSIALESFDTIQNCTFKNLPNCIHKFKAIDTCLFENCAQIAQNDRFVSRSEDDEPEMECSVKICLFNRCTNILTNISVVSNCQFIECKNDVIKVAEGYLASVQSSIIGYLAVTHCQFYNWKCDDGVAATIIDFSQINGENILSGCVFDGVESYSEFIGSPASFEDIAHLLISNCEFHHIAVESPSYDEDNGIVRRTHTFHYGPFNKREKVVTSVTLENCKGLGKLNKEGSSLKKVPVKYKTDEGKLIGIDSEELDAGVSGFDYTSR